MYKRGNKTDRNKFRGISLVSNPYKYQIIIIIIFFFFFCVHMVTLKRIGRCSRNTRIYRRHTVDLWSL